VVAEAASSLSYDRTLQYYLSYILQFVAPRSRTSWALNVLRPIVRFVGVRFLEGESLLRIRLRRVGKKKQPQYRLVVANARSPRDGAFLEILGQYNPLTNPATITVNEERTRAWLQQGAQPSDTVAKILVKQGILDKSKAPSRGAVEPSTKAPSPACRRSVRPCRRSVRPCRSRCSARGQGAGSGDRARSQQ
jgi:small subunit ribosomal protein S16